MGNLTEHYNKRKSGEQERKNRNDYYRDVMNKTPYLIEMHKHNSNSEGYLLDYENSLALQRCHKQIDNNTKDNNTKTQVLNTHQIQDSVNSIHDPAHN